MNSAFKLILVSPEEHPEGELDNVIQLFNLGLESYHLRKPAWSKEEMQDFLSGVPDKFQKNIVLHSYFELGELFNIKAIHLNESNKKLISQLSGHNIVSASFHSISELQKNIFPYQYVFLSPVFDGISKAGYTSNFDLKTLTSDLAAVRLENPNTKVVALGGVNAQNIDLAKDLGFSGVAVLGAIWQSKNPVEAFLEIQSKIKVG